MEPNMGISGGSKEGQNDRGQEGERYQRTWKVTSLPKGHEGQAWQVNTGSPVTLSWNNVS